MTYDDNRMRVILDSVETVRLYVQQNEGEDVRRRRRVREQLRGLNVASSDMLLMEGKTNLIFGSG
jgi:hypothetical protein